MKPDLTLLYSELGLEPNCSLEEFQLAYRRRISELQPNRGAGGTQSPESASLLRDLIWLYTSANRFHRRYGRLPGEAPHRFGSTGNRTPPPVIQQTHIVHTTPPPDHRSAASPRIALALAITLLVLLFVVLAMASGEWLR